MSDFRDNKDLDYGLAPTRRLYAVEEVADLRAKLLSQQQEMGGKATRIADLELALKEQIERAEKLAFDLKIEKRFTASLQGGIDVLNTEYLRRLATAERERDAANERIRHLEGEYDTCPGCGEIGEHGHSARDRRAGEGGVDERIIRYSQASQTGYQDGR